MADNAKPTTLAPPAVTALREEAAGPSPHRVQMERTVSQDIREEREDLKEAAEHSLAVIMELGLNGTIRHVSNSWEEVIGTSAKDVVGKPVADLLVGNSDLFNDAVEMIKKDDSRSRIIRFQMRLGPTSILRRKGSRHADEGEVGSIPQSPLSPMSAPDEENQLVNLEAQGILCYDRTTGAESHVSHYSHSSCPSLTA
jgi:serine/threonine-protein kinase RIM15